MRIVTYNLHYGGIGQTHWQEILDRYDPDVFLVQESFSPSEQLPSTPHGLKAQNAVWASAIGVKGDLKWGSGVYVKSQRPKPVSLPKFHGWVTAAEIDVAGLFSISEGRLRIVSLHAPSGMGSYQDLVNEILDMLRDHIDGCEMVIGGDFNLTVGQRHPSEERATKDADRKIQDRLRDEFGLINCWQTANPDQPLPQTLRWASKSEVPFHCDGIFVPAGWRERLRSCKVISGGIWNDLSDHNPVIAEFTTE